MFSDTGLAARLTASGLARRAQADPEAAPGVRRGSAYRSRRQGNVLRRLDIARQAGKLAA